MGILRTDRITGLGGANAIKGSAHFHGGGDGGGLETEVSSDFQFGSGNFTIEVWANFSGFDSSGFETIVKSGNTNGSNSMFQFDYKSSESKLRIIPYVSNSSVVKQVSFTPEFDRWYHLAAVRDGNNLKIFIDGTQTGGDLSFSDTIDSETTGLSIGKRAMSDENNGFERNFNGYLSNLRIVKGTAIYTADFTPPTNELEKTSDTVLLALQSPGNLFQEATGKKLYVAGDRANQQSVTASKFTPNSPVGFSTTTDVGSQYGSTFDGFGSFATSTYMVPPGGNTRERNRGRAVFGGGESPTADNVMEYLNIQSGGRTIDFGDHSANTPNGDAVASSTRGVFTVHNSPANSNALEFITIANTGNSQDFGDQTTGGVSQEAAASNSTRGLFAGGIFPGSTVHDTTEYITIATLGNAVDFGNLIASVTSNTGVADATRALFAGGIGPSSPFPTVNRIEYFTIANTGNATDFGDLTFSARYPSSAGDSTRGVFMGGATPSATNTMCFVTIQTTGDATDFGDLVTASHDAAATSDSVRAIMGAGGTPSNTNTIEKITIQTTGNAVDYGDLSRKVSQLGACSDSHGGIS